MFNFSETNGYDSWIKRSYLKSRQLQDEEQKQIAKMLDDEIKWDTTLESTEDKLGKIAQEALYEYKGGKTKTQDW